MNSDTDRFQKSFMRFSATKKIPQNKANSEHPRG